MHATSFKVTWQYDFYTQRDEHSHSVVTVTTASRHCKQARAGLQDGIRRLMRDSPRDYWPVDVRLVDNKQYFASVAVRRRPLVVPCRLSTHPAQSSRRCCRHLPHAGAERTVTGADGRPAALYRRSGDLLMTVAVRRRRPRHVIVQVTGAESSTEEVDPRRDVVAKAWVGNVCGWRYPT